MSSARRWTLIGGVVVVVAAACSGSSEPLSVDAYVEAMQTVEVGFAETAPDPLGNPETRDRYPLGGDLVIASDLYMAYEDRLAGWRSLTPPAELAESHTILVAALATVQDAVGDYLGKEALSGEDLDFGSIGAKVNGLLSAAGTACRELRTAVEGAGSSIDFSDDCRI